MRCEVLPSVGPMAFLSTPGSGWDGTLAGAIAALAAPGQDVQPVKFATTVLDATGGDITALAEGTVALPAKPLAKAAAVDPSQHAREAAPESSQAALDELMASEPESGSEADEAVGGAAPSATDQAAPAGIANVWSSDEDDESD